MSGKAELGRINTEDIQFGYNVIGKKTEEYSLHCHNHYEIYYFLEGDIDYLVEGCKYKPQPGSMLLLAPHAFHGFRVRTEGAYRRYTLHFNPEILSLERRAFLLSAFPTVHQDLGRNIYYEDVERYNMDVYYNALEDCAELEESVRGQMVQASVEALLSRIVYMYEKENAEQQRMRDDTVSDIIWYLNQNLSKEITLDGLAEKFYISKHHLNKVFRKATGTTVFDYLIRKRVSMAQHLLINGFGAQDAAAEAGFADYSAFYRSYVRVFGHSPSQDKGEGRQLYYPHSGKMESVILKSREK